MVKALLQLLETKVIYRTIEPKRSPSHNSQVLGITANSWGACVREFFHYKRVTPLPGLLATFSATLDSSSNVCIANLDYHSIPLLNMTLNMFGRINTCPEYRDGQQACVTGDKSLYQCIYIIHLGKL